MNDIHSKDSPAFGIRVKIVEYQMFQECEFIHELQYMYVWYVRVHVSMYNVSIYMYVCMHLFVMLDETWCE